MDLLRLMRNRRSVRAYTGERLPEETLDQIVRAGLLAPSSRNIRPVELIVVEDRDLLCALAKSKAAGAAHVADSACAIVVIGEAAKADAWTEDCCVAMSYMMLMAEQLGVGSCWIQERLRSTSSGQASGDYVKELLAIPEQYEVEAVLALGFPTGHPGPREWDESERNKVHRDRF